MLATEFHVRVAREVAAGHLRPVEVGDEAVVVPHLAAAGREWAGSDMA